MTQPTIQCEITEVTLQDTRILDKLDAWHYHIRIRKDTRGYYILANSMCLNDKGEWEPSDSWGRNVFRGSDLADDEGYWSYRFETLDAAMRTAQKYFSTVKVMGNTVDDYLKWYDVNFGSD